MEYMDNDPYAFISGYSEADLANFNSFVHRTFNGIDCTYFIKALSEIYTNHGGLEQVFLTGYQTNASVWEGIAHWRAVFLSYEAPSRTGKHFANVEKGSAGKRLNMYLRWMVRTSENSIDFNLWKQVDPAHLLIPLDVHSGRISRELGMLVRKQNDRKAVDELSASCRLLDPKDPAKYDLPLFGLGAFDKF